MSYTLLQSQPQGQACTLSLSGQLTIRNNAALHAELLEHARQQQGLQLEITAVEDIDVAFLQLLIALSQYHDVHQKPFKLRLNLDPALQTLLKTAGFSSTLNTIHA